MTYVVKLIEPLWDMGADGVRSYKGWPVAPGADFLAKSRDGVAIATTYCSSRALQFASELAAKGDAEVQRIGHHYRFEIEPVVPD